MELTESDYHFICAFKCKYMVGDFTLLTPENLLAAYKFLNSEATSEKSSWLEAYV